ARPRLRGVALEARLLAVARHARAQVALRLPRVVVRLVRRRRIGPAVGMELARAVGRERRIGGRAPVGDAEPLVAAEAERLAAVARAAVGIVLARVDAVARDVIVAVEVE